MERQSAAFGSLVWQRTYGTGPTEPFFRADEFIAIAGDGSIVVAGWAQSPPYASDSTSNGATDAVILRLQR
jgi:hypothetical protein